MHTLRKVEACELAATPLALPTSATASAIVMACMVFVGASCGGGATNAPPGSAATTAQPASATPPVQVDPMPSTAPGNAHARPSTTAQPLGEWVRYALPDGTADARFPQAPATELLDEHGGSLVWAEWDGAGFAILSRPAPASDRELATIAATAAAAVLDGLFGVEPGTIPASDVTVATGPTAVRTHGRWATRALALEGNAMGTRFLVRCRAHTSDTRLVLHLLVVEPSALGDADAFFDTLVLH